MGNRRVVAAPPEKAAQQNPPPCREGNGKLDELSADRLCEAVVDAVHGLGAWQQWLTASEREAAREALRRATVLVSPHAREPISGDVQYHVKVEP